MGGRGGGVMRISEKENFSGRGQTLGVQGAGFRMHTGDGCWRHVQLFCGNSGLV